MSQAGKILIVDDEVDIVKIVRRYLENWGFSVDTFTNPELALRFFKENPERYSVALLDIRMPEMSGITLATLLQQIRPDIKVVIMTAFEIDPNEMRKQLPMITYEDILQKPFKLLQVCTAIKKHLKVV